MSSIDGACAAEGPLAAGGEARGWLPAVAWGGGNHVMGCRLGGVSTGAGDGGAGAPPPSGLLPLSAGPGGAGGGGLLPACHS
jgi:hypothetical protein